MTSPVNHSEDAQHIHQGEDLLDEDLDSSAAFPALIQTTANRRY